MLSFLYDTEKMPGGLPLHDTGDPVTDDSSGSMAGNVPLLQPDRIGKKYKYSNPYRGYSFGLPKVSATRTIRT
jgi:hypothetical protein